MAVPHNMDEERTIRRLEELGPAQVRLLMQNGGWALSLQPVTLKWLAQEDQESARLSDAANAVQADAVSRAALAAERQATAAEKANTRATLALIIAIVSAIATAIGIWVVHWDTTHTSPPKAASNSEIVWPTSSPDAWKAASASISASPSTARAPSAVSQSCS